MKFIISLLIIFFVLRLVLKPLLRLVITSVLSKMAQQGGTAYKSYTYTTKQKSKPEGTIEVEQKPQNSKGKDGSYGEYIDYEEVK
ncbi:MAG: DUF4834 family protein [Cytophagales bacterium]|nr:MAG: DUF4834 family protein [Cytophagales bacterium]